MADEATFLRRLRHSKLTLSQFERILGTPDAHLEQQTGASPEWIRRFLEVFADRDPADEEDPSRPASDEEVAASAMLRPLLPLVRRSTDSVRAVATEILQKYLDVPIDETTIVEIVLDNLPDRLVRVMFERTYVLELASARLEGRLNGADAHARFDDFSKSVSQPSGSRRFFREYPVLARQLLRRIDDWEFQAGHFLEALAGDWSDLRAAFFAKGDPGRLIHLESEAGDRHRHGKAVMILTFESGARLVYKPKSVAIDKHMQDVLGWLGDRTGLNFQTTRVLDRGTHGWVEFVERRDCASKEDVERFYQRLGGLLGLLHTMNAVDFHQENIVASGDQPILIDLESVLQPRIQRSVPESISAAADDIAESVLRVGVLPQRIFTHDGYAGFQAGGLAPMGGQLSTEKVPKWCEPATDVMTIIRERITLGESHNEPRLLGEQVQSIRYAPALEEGFRATYTVLMESRVALLSPGGLLAQCATDEIRVIPRPTYFYGLISYESFHPTVLRNGLDRDRHLDWLWLGVSRDPWLERLVSSERRAIDRMDIPLFTTRPDSLELCGEEDERIQGCIVQSGMAYLSDRLEQLSPGDLERQCWYLRAAMATLSGRRSVQGVGRYSLPRSADPVESKDLLAEALKIADRLAESSFRSYGKATWVGLAAVGDEEFTLAPSGAGLYGGNLGIAMFLSQVSSIAGTERHASLAREAVEGAREILRTDVDAVSQIGAFEGWGGVVYAFTHLATSLGEAELLDSAEEALRRLVKRIPDDEAKDVVGGSAGAILALRALHSVRPSSDCLHAMIACGDRLCATAEEQEIGVAWNAGDQWLRPTSGLSHGTSGIAWSLLELARIVGDDRYQRVALEALRYEHSLYSSERKNWAIMDRVDGYRERAVSDGDRSFMTTWCHGAPGVALALTLGLRSSFSDMDRSLMEAALMTTLDEGFGTGHSLCHGDLGNLEILTMVASLLNDDHWSYEAAELAPRIVRSILEHGPICGNALGVESPGLMSGLAGIGYGLLRLGFPAIVPSVLALESPRVRVSAT